MGIMNIKPYDSKIRTVFETGFYKIPRFQRPYSWDRGNIEEFWTDIVASDVDAYFIGSMVFFKPKGKGEFRVVDGQQRLTTITIFLAALRDTIHEIGEKALATGIQNVIQRKDIDNELRFVLLTESSYPFFQEHIQKFGEPEIKVEIGPEEKGIKEAYDFAFERLKGLIQEAKNNSGNSKKKSAEQIRKLLQRCRDRLLELRVIIVELDNEDDAYVIFETLNTRGKDLEPADLVKTLITRLIPPGSADVDPTKTRWNKMVRVIGESAANLDMSTYIHHFWLSREEYTSKKTLFKRIKNRIVKAHAKAFLNDLETGVSIYRKIFEPDNFDWNKEEAPAVDSLRALAIFKVRQPTPLVFSLLRAYEEEQISLKQLKQTFVIIERFHFVHTAIASMSSSGGMSMMYAAAGRDLFSKTHSQQCAQHLQEFRKRMRRRIPDWDIYLAGFSDLTFTSMDTRHKPLIRYILEKVDTHLRDDKITDYDKMTVEHISPEHSATAQGATLIGSLGNLIFVSTELNKKLKNKPFSDKKQLLKTAGVPLGKTLAAANKWTDEEISKRSTELAKLTYKDIW
jgi:uncharacterized protein with ParB-like and HNH nuclease domain